MLAKKFGSTFEAIKTCRRKSKCLRETRPRLELNIIKIKVRFHLHNLEKIFLVYQEHRTHAMGTDILTVLILHIKQTLDNMFILQEKDVLAVTRTRTSILLFFNTSSHIILKPVMKL